MTWERRVERVTRHVRSHLSDELAVADLAKIAHFSPFHFARVFKSTTGETLVQFVQRARLERRRRAAGSNSVTSSSVTCSVPFMSRVSRTECQHRCVVQ
jgi:AraC family transcriptional regulator